MYICTYQKIKLSKFKGPSKRKTEYPDDINFNITTMKSDNRKQKPTNGDCFVQALVCTLHKAFGFIINITNKESLIQITWPAKR